MAKGQRTIRTCTLLLLEGLVFVIYFLLVFLRLFQGLNLSACPKVSTKEPKDGEGWLERG
jgi:hypothetical protein